MYVEYSGWTETKGSFQYSIFIDTNKSDYEIQYENGFVAKQTSPFETFTYDWNHDGDTYPLFGAWFASRLGGNDFFTPVDLVSTLIDSMMGEDLSYSDRIAAITGIELPEELKPVNNKRKGR